MGAQLAGAFLAVLSFGILLEVPKKHMLKAGAVGTTCWLVYLLLIRQEFTVIMATFLASLVISVLGHIGARVFKAPVTVFLIPGIFPLVPGASIYRCVAYLIQSDMQLANHYLTEAIQISGAIALAIFITDSIFKVWQKGKRRRALIKAKTADS